MKKITLLFIGLCLLFSCSKDKSNVEIPEEKACNVVSFSTAIFKKVEIVYDNMGRVTEYIKQDPSYLKTALSYEKNSIKAIYSTIIEGKPQVHGTYGYEVDNQGRITSSTLDGYSRYKYEYNAEGYLSRVTGNEVDIHKMKFDYANGNITAIDINRIDGATTIENDNLKPYVPFSFAITDVLEGIMHDADIALYESGFFGKLPKNRFLKIKNYPGDGKKEVTISYKEDLDGKVVLVNNGFYESALGYECKD